MKKIKDAVFNLGCKFYLKSITGSLGDIIETENEIVCNIKEIDSKEHTLFLVKKNDYEQLCKMYGINKPIVFNFNGVIFKNTMFIYSNFPMIFKNCKFNMGLEIFSSNSIYLDDNNFNKDFMLGKLEIDCKELNINNERIDIGNTILKDDSNKSVKLTANKISMNDTRIYTNGPYKDIEIKADELYLNFSILSSSNITINVDEIKTETTAIGLGNDEVYINNLNENEIGEIGGKTLIYNGVRLDGIGLISKDNKETYAARNRLIKTLSLVRDKCGKRKIKDIL